ncbi:MAG: hypothetical protein FWF81_00515 [Defluviitaleaceae bacterium]|nr:hypothetical protein [Defluviitaleaceae bacterium]
MLASTTGMTLGALGTNPLLSNQPYVKQASNTYQNATSFDEVLNSAMDKGDVVNRLRSLGLPIRIKDMPRRVGCFSELAHGLTIAPNILNRMAQDEAYLQEIEQQIDYWFNVHGPMREREAARSFPDDNFTVFLEFTIKPNGEIVKSSVVILDSRIVDETCEVVNSFESANNESSVTSYSANVDASYFSALVGNINFQNRRRDD